MPKTLVAVTLGVLVPTVVGCLAQPVDQNRLAEPTEAEMQAAVQTYLDDTAVGGADRPEYFDPTRIASFKKRECAPLQGQLAFACRFSIEVGTQYREARTSYYSFHWENGSWTTNGPTAAR